MWDFQTLALDLAVVQNYLEMHLLGAPSPIAEISRRLSTWLESGDKLLVLLMSFSSAQLNRMGADLDSDVNLALLRDLLGVKTHSFSRPSFRRALRIEAKRNQPVISHYFKSVMVASQYLPTAFLTSTDSTTYLRGRQKTKYPIDVLASDKNSDELVAWGIAYDKSCILCLPAPFIDIKDPDLPLESDVSVRITQALEPIRAAFPPSDFKLIGKAPRKLHRERSSKPPIRCTDDGNIEWYGQHLSLTPIPLKLLKQLCRFANQRLDRKKVMKAIGIPAEIEGYNNKSFKTHLTSIRVALKKATSKLSEPLKTAAKKRFNDGRIIHCPRASGRIIFNLTPSDISL